MKKNIVTLSAIAAFCIPSFANDVTNQKMMEELKVLKKQVTTLENKLAQVQKTAQKAKAQSAGDNLKWSVDLRTQIDNIEYEHIDGSKSKNSSLMTNRLWLGMKYAADDNSIFYGTLSYLKAFGDTANHSQSNTAPMYANFDWVTNENALDNTLKVKEAYWLYKNDSFFGNENISWTASIGRRPSTDGLGINVRANQKRKSALSHTVNVEFDGASARFDLDQVTGVEGMWLKFCAGRGLTNAKPRFSPNGDDYAKDKTQHSNVDMFGFIFVPYDNGQYSIHTNYARAWNMIGFNQETVMAGMGLSPEQIGQMGMNPKNIDGKFHDVGDLDLATMMLKVDGIGDGISDYLDETNFFISAAMSKTRPNAKGMLGTRDNKTGHSLWLGVNAPCPLFPDSARIGIEWNKGSKYWRSMTYGEDTMAGSKIAARGTAFEIYRNQQLTKALSFGVSYTHINYDYTGSNGFFGAEGSPMSKQQVKQYRQMGVKANPVTSAQDIKAYLRYSF